MAFFPHFPNNTTTLVRRAKFPEVDRKTLNVHRGTTKAAEGWKGNDAVCLCRKCAVSSKCFFFRAQD